MCRQWLDSATLGQEELLFGRVGYLAALLQLDKHLGLKSVELGAKLLLVRLLGPWFHVHNMSAMCLIRRFSQIGGHGD